MHIFVKNAKCAGYTKNQIVEAVEFFASKLMTKRLSDTLTIHVRFDKNLQYSGLATWLDEPFRGKEYSIKINHIDSEDSIFQTLAHEMVHIKQYAKGELRDLLSYSDQVTWRGARHKSNNEGDDYMNQPWEQEAFEKEEILYKLFCERN